MKHKIFTLKTKASSINDDDRTLTAVISTDDLDHHNEITVQDGIDIDEFMTNPIVLDNHNQGAFGEPTNEDPIGKVLEIHKSKNQTEAKIQFTSQDENPVGYQKFLLYKGGYLNAFSIGMQVLEEEQKDLNGAIVNYLNKTRLYEVSAALLPANKEARVKTFNTDDNKKVFDKTKNNTNISSMDEKTLLEQFKSLNDKLDTNHKFLTEFAEKVDSKIDALKTEEPAEEPADDDETKAEEDEVYAEAYAEEADKEESNDDGEDSKEGSDNE